MTVKFSHDRKVRSLAKKTLGSTRVGRAIRLPGAVWRRGWLDILAGLPDSVTICTSVCTSGRSDWLGLEERYCSRCGRLRVSDAGELRRTTRGREYRGGEA